VRVLPAHRRDDAGDRDARQDGIDRRAVGEAELLAANHVDSNDMQRDRAILELLGSDIAGDQLAQARGWD
jgi:hypothetical protein